MHEICKYHPEILMTRMPNARFSDLLPVCCMGQIHQLVHLSPRADPCAAPRGGTRVHVHARRWDIMSPARIPRAAVLECARGAGPSGLGHRRWDIMSSPPFRAVPALGLIIRFEST